MRDDVGRPSGSSLPLTGLFKTKMLPKCPKNKLKVSLKKKTKRAYVKPAKVDVLIWLGYISMMQKLSTAAQLQAKEEKDNCVNSYHIRKVADDVLKSCKA